MTTPYVNKSDTKSLLDFYNKQIVDLASLELGDEMALISIDLRKNQIVELADSFC